MFKTEGMLDDGTTYQTLGVMGPRLYLLTLKLQW